MVCTVAIHEKTFTMSISLLLNKRVLTRNASGSDTKIARLSTAAQETEHAAVTDTVLIVLVNTSARHLSTIIHSHAIRAALTCRGSGSLFSTFGRAAVQKRV
jgi:hypothetical protein